MAVTRFVLAFFSFFFIFSLFPNTTSGLDEGASQSFMQHHHHHHHHENTKHGKEIKLFVAQDGSKEFGTIGDALNAAMDRRKIEHQMINIHIKEGTYKEHLDIKVHNISLIGAGIGKTIITGDRIRGNAGTDDTATVTVSGRIGALFIARGITFRNTAGLPNKEHNQAVALRSDKGNSAFYQCSFEGYQDTLLADSGNQFYRDCSISGSVDFIFGNALAIFQRCNIIVRPSRSDKSIITAQGREKPHENTGFIFQNSKFYPSDEMRPLIESKSKEVYLGRPWKMFARTIILNSELEGIHGQGWIKWNKTTSTDNVEFLEYGNTGTSASTDERVKWKKFHVLHNWEDARKYTLGGGFWNQFNWLEGTNVPFDRDL